MIGRRPVQGAVRSWNACRDLAGEGQIQVVLAYSPDRLSRKYLYQILLTEEFARHAVETLLVKSRQETARKITSWFSSKAQNTNERRSWSARVAANGIVHRLEKCA